MALAIRRFTVEEYLRMAETGILHEDDRVELLDGRIVEMSPIGPPHAATVDRLNRLLSRLVGDRAIVRVQGTVVLDAHSAPEPDIALLQPPIEQYVHAHPTPAQQLLVIEVADTSLAYDRDTKVPMYARARVPEAWLVNLREGTVEVFTQPGPGGYRSTRRIGREGTLRPVMLPDLEVAATDILG